MSVEKIDPLNEGLRQHLVGIVLENRLQELLSEGVSTEYAERVLAAECLLGRLPETDLLRVVEIIGARSLRHFRNPN